MSTTEGGASKSGLTLVRGLKKLGIEIVAACPTEGSLSEVLRKDGIAVETFGYEWAYPYFQRTFMGALKFIPKMFRDKIRNRKALHRMLDFAEKFKPDLIHTNTGVADIGFRLARHLNLPHISHFREFGWKDCSAVMWHERRLHSYRLQHGIAIGKEILKWHSRPNDDNILIYNGIVNQGDSRISPNKESYFLYVGALFKEKGIEDLLEAYSRINIQLRKMHPLKIAGSTVDLKYMDYLSDLTRELDIADDVEWLGERHDIADLMYKARALVVPSHNEAFGRIVVEGIINGCLVVGRNRAGIKEQFDNGLATTSKEIGLRFDTVEQLSTILSKIAESDVYFTEQSSTMIPMGQKTVEGLYSIQGYIDSVADFYKKIITCDSTSHCES